MSWEDADHEDEYVPDETNPRAAMAWIEEVRWVGPFSTYRDFYRKRARWVSDR
jgi:hypothetical protein